MSEQTEAQLWAARFSEAYDHWRRKAPRNPDSVMLAWEAEAFELLGMVDGRTIYEIAHGVPRTGDWLDHDRLYPRGFDGNGDQGGPKC